MSMSEILLGILGDIILAYPFWISYFQLTSILVISRSMVHLCVHYLNVWKNISKILHIQRYFDLLYINIGGCSVIISWNARRRLKCFCTTWCFNFPRSNYIHLYYLPRLSFSLFNWKFPKLFSSLFIKLT
jgi:hypothetical protein